MTRRPKLRTTHVWSPDTLARELRRYGGWSGLTLDELAAFARAADRLEASAREYAAEGDRYHASGCELAAKEIRQGLAGVTVIVEAA